MSRALWRAAGAAVALGAALGGAALSAIPWAGSPTDQAVLRLSWRVRAEARRDCRRPTEAELARLPVHMRQREICERRIPPHRLTVVLDGRRLVDDTIRATGARADRPLTVFRELAITPGRHPLEVRFGPLRLRDTIEARPGAITLVTHDPDRRGLVVREDDS